ncbi:hypothetical protein [Trujillonella endophytica]|uniref:Uncharacterized protein n=1 Tax=Trujillonella endophytica TaxID=673521 RepID=A0A1H8V2M6_9ACTN|nr:hypothetical protein [Trujillella endophytica]SEP09679.1 hypothetical protein SAMN05660991_03237 [Trujillella endophytica]
MAARALNVVATVVRVVCSVIGAIVALYAVFVFFEANPANGLVEFARGIREDFGGFTTDLFTPDDPKVRETVNAAIAAIVWVVAGSMLSKLIVRLAPASRAKTG